MNSKTREAHGRMVTAKHGKAHGRMVLTTATTLFCKIDAAHCF
jgi:hypothetical protein